MLVSKKTNLKSLKYGGDKKGGGSSNQPYIVKEISEGEDSTFLTPFIKRKDDVVRLSKMFTDPKGLLFITKQNILSRTSVKTEASEGIGYGKGIFNQGIYTPTSTLTQAGVSGTGTNLNFLGLDPSSPMAGVVNWGLLSLIEENNFTLGLQRYEDVVIDKNKKGQNRLETLYSTIFFNGTKTQSGFLNSLSFNNNVNVLSYSGGPGSVLGIGKTNIKFSKTGRTGINNIELQASGFFNEGIVNAFDVFKKKLVKLFLDGRNI